MGLGDSHLNIPGGGNDGFHVLRVQHGSPGHQAGLEPCFDFIVCINGVRLDTDDDKLKELLHANINRHVELLVYNCKTQTVRKLPLTPHEQWGGKVCPSFVQRLDPRPCLSQGLLGLSIRFGNFERANENVWHVLDVHPNSPAALAGLHSETDYVVGADTLLTDSEEFYTLIETSQGNALRLYVYNCETDAIREVMLTPNIGWGGQGSLGCGIGYGYLHRIPFQTARSTPLTKPHPAVGNSIKAPLLAGMPPLNMSFTLQPINMPPITVTTPSFLFSSPASPFQSNDSSQLLK